MSLSSAKKDLPLLLLLEPDGLVRGTTAAVCRDLGVANVIQAIHCQAAFTSFQDEQPHAAMLSLSEQASVLDLLACLRRGELRCRSDMPVAVIASDVDADLARSLKDLQVRRLLLKPFKIRDSIATVEALLPPVVRSY